MALNLWRSAEVNAADKFISSVMEYGFGLEDDATRHGTTSREQAGIGSDSVGGQYNLKDGRLHTEWRLNARQLQSKDAPADRKADSPKRKAGAGKRKQ